MWSRTHPVEEPARRARLARGTASVEAVIVLPVLVILFVSAFYIRNQVLARQAAESKGRACAWAFSMNNCNSVPPGCEQLLKVVRAAAPLNDRMDKALSDATGTFAGPIISGVLKPFVDLALGQSVDAKARVAYERPVPYGGGTQNASGGYHLACNLEPETLEDIGKDAWDALCSSF